MKQRAATAALSVFACVTAACSESPRTGFEAFYGAIINDRAADALERLSPPARAQLEAAAAGANVKDALLQGTVKKSLRTIVEVARADDAHATLDITDALGKHQHVAMVKVGERWLVDVVDADAPVAP